MLFSRPRFLGPCKGQRPLHPNEAIPGLRRGTFCSCRKYPKTRLGAKIRVRQRLPKDGSLAHRIIPLRTPVFTGAQDRVMQRPISGVEVSRRSLLPISARRSIGGCSILPGPRDTPAADGPSRPGALPWAAGASALGRISGSGAGGRECPSYLCAGR